MRAGDAATTAAGAGAGAGAATKAGSSFTARNAAVRDDWRPGDGEWKPGTFYDPNGPKVSRIEREGGEESESCID